MKALVLEGIGEVLQLKHCDLPTLETDDVLVEVKAAALNRRDWWIQQGKYAGLKFPIILGSDGAGIVTQVGSTELDYLLHKEVIINPSLHWGNNENYQSHEFKILGLPDDGTLADYVKVSSKQVYDKPTYLSFEEAAAIPLAALTAYRALFKKAKLSKAETVLITGVGAGTASFALLFAVAVGAKVYVTSGSSEKIEKAKSHGAIDGVNYHDKNWDEQLSKLTDGFDVVIDSALGDGFSKFLNLCKPGARIVFFGATNGNITELNGRTIFWKQLQILGTTMGSDSDFKEMLEFINQHQIKPIVDEVLPMSEANLAFKKMNQSNQFGKIVLKND